MIKALQLISVEELASRLGNRISMKEIRAFYPRKLVTDEIRQQVIDHFLKNNVVEFNDKNLFNENSTRDEKSLVELQTMQCLDRLLNRLVLFTHTGRYMLYQLKCWRAQGLYDSFTPEETDISEALMSDRIELDELLEREDWELLCEEDCEQYGDADLQLFLEHNLIHPKGVETLLKACEYMLEQDFENLSVTRAELDLFYRLVSYIVNRINMIKNKITADYQPLISQIVRRYRRGNILRQDLLQEGNIGLLKAIERFDARKGERFSIYASWWIRQEITRAIIYQGSVVRLPVRVFRKVNQIKNLKERISQEQGREPSDSQLAHFSDLSSNEISHLQKVTPIILSLEAGKAADDDRVPLELPDPAYSNLQIEFLEKEGIKGQVRDLLSCLDKREANIVKRRFGIEFRAPQTLDEIGRFYNLSRERIRQIEAKAIKKMEIFAQKLLENQTSYETELMV